MPSPVILNSAFTVASYNGGSLKGRNGIDGMLRVAAGEPCRPHGTRNGTNFDLVLDYKSPNPEVSTKFTLTHVVIMAPEYSLVTAPLKDGMVWVSQVDEATIDTSYADFNDMTETKYLANPTLEPRPTFFEISPRGTDTVSVVPKSCNSVGNRVHIKFVSSYGEDDNIDMGNFYLIGYHGEAPSSFVAPEVQYCVANGTLRQPAIDLGIVQPTIEEGVVNELTPSLQSFMISSPCVFFLSKNPIKDLSPEAFTAYNNLNQLAASTYKEKHEERLANFDDEASPADTNLVFFHVDPTTESIVAKQVLSFLGASATGKNAIELPSEPIANQLIDPKNVYELNGVIFKESSSVDDPVDEDIEIPEPSLTVGDIQLHNDAEFVIAAFDQRTTTVKFLYQSQDFSALRAALKVEGDDTKTDIDVFVKSFLVICNNNDATANAIIAATETGLTVEQATEAALAIPDSEEYTALSKVFTRYISSSTTPLNFTHPLYPNLYIATTDNFVESVLENPEHTLVALSSDSTPEFQQSVVMVCELAEHLAAYKFPVKVVIIDANRNAMEPEYFPNPESQPIKLYVKRAKADAPKAIVKSKSKTVGKAKTKVVEDVKPEAKVFYTTKSGVEVFAHPFDFAQGMDVDDEEDEMHDLGQQGMTMPTVMTLINLIHEHLPALFKPLPPKSFTTEGVKIEKAVQSLSYCLEANGTVFSNLRSLLRIKGLKDGYTYPKEGTKTADVVATVKRIHERARVLRNEIPTPAGNLKIQIDVPVPESITSRVVSEEATTSAGHKGMYPYCIMIRDVADELIQMRDDTEKCLLDIQDIFRATRHSCTFIENFVRTFKTFPEVCATFISDSKNRKLVQDFGSAWNTVFSQVGLGHSIDINPALVAAFEKASVKIESGIQADHQYQVVEKELLTAMESLQKFLQALSQSVAVAVEDVEKKCLHSDFRRIRSEKQLVRALEGFKIITVKLAARGTKKTAEQIAKEKERVSDLNRLVVVYVTSVSDGSIEILPELSALMQELAEASRERIEKGIEGAHPVYFLKVDADECPDVAETLDADASFPTFVFTQTGAEITDLRIEDLPTGSICEALRAAVNSFHETSIDEEMYEDEDMEDDEDNLEEGDDHELEA